VIYGIGTDICDVRRIRATLQRRGERFAERVLGANELAVFRARRARAEVRGVAYLATRFSAKEAFSKAIGLGIRMPMTWSACEILNEPSGKPFVRLNGALAEWFDARGLCAHVTVTDETDYAASFVVVETRSPLPVSAP
jgi:holo-[acyl-carrier protein] synthase